MFIDCDARTSSPACIVMEDTPDHDAEVEELYGCIFGPGRHARAAERLREGNRLHRSCSRLALSGLGGSLLATVRLWPLSHEGDNFVHRAGLLGPVAVVPEIRGAGLGRRLCRSVIRAAFSFGGYTALVLVGDLSYFSRMGFEVADSGLVMPSSVAPGRLLVRYAEEGSPILRGILSVPRVAIPASSELVTRRRREFLA